MSHYHPSIGRDQLKLPEFFYDVIAEVVLVWRIDEHQVELSVFGTQAVEGAKDINRKNACAIRHRQRAQVRLDTAHRCSR